MAKKRRGAAWKADKVRCQDCRAPCSWARKADGRWSLWDIHRKRWHWRACRKQEEFRRALSEEKRLELAWRGAMERDMAEAEK